MKTATVPERMQDWWRAHHYSSCPPPVCAEDADALLVRFYAAQRELEETTDALWQAQQKVMAAHAAAVARGED